jgi:putative ABC transport system permease protein
MLDDLKFALRRLRHSPGFVVVAVLTLAVVVGANTAILSVADAVLFRPLPFRDPDRVFLMQILNQKTGTRSTRFDNAFIDAINDRHPGVGAVGIFEPGPRVVTDGPDGAEAVPTLAVSANYLDVLGVSATRGRVFALGDTPGRAAMLTDASWRSRFGGDPNVVGRSVTVGNTAFDIIGILPQGFSFASSSFFAGRPEIVTLMAPVPPGTTGGVFHPVVRLEPGETREQAQAQMDAVVTSARAAKPQLAGQTPFLENIRETIYPVGRDVMRFLFAAAVLVLLVGCANLANMLLARGRRFERDTAVRTAMGASRLRVVRPLLMEAVLIGVAGSAVALLVTALGFDALLRQVPTAAYGGAPVGLDSRIVLMGLALGIGGGLLFSVVPALRSARLDVLALLQGRHRGSRSQWRIGRPMIAVQVALAVVLVFGAAIATRAFVSVVRTPLGFDPENVVRVQAAPPRGTTDIGGFYRRVVEYLASRPDVSLAGASGTPPLSGQAGWSSIVRPGTKERLASLVHTLPGYFETLGVRPSAGRTLQWQDAGTGGAVITEGAARALFGDEPPLGRTIDAGELGGQLRVVGVVPAPRDRMDAESDVVAHVHMIPTGRTTVFSVFAKVKHRDSELLRGLRRDLGVLAPGVPVGVTWWVDGIGALSAMRDPRFQALVLGSFATIAIGLTGVGVFAIVAFLVANRTREMGIRLAIGAEPRALVRLMVGQAIVPVVVGLAVGLVSAKYAARLAESRFVKLDTSDPWPLVIAGVVVLVATLLAALAPARRAARVDPTIVLRAE